MTTKTKKPMSDAHKQALAEGRQQGRAVRAYLEALETKKAKPRGRRTVEWMQERLGKIEHGLREGFDPFSKGSGVPIDVLRKLDLTQESLDLMVEINEAQRDDGNKLEDLELAFIGAAKAYSARKGISYGAWSALGVPSKVLKAAGIKETSEERRRRIEAAKAVREAHK